MEARSAQGSVGDGDPGTDRLQVAVDATPLLGPRTGVGAFCAGALDALAKRREIALSAFAVSWRRRRRIVDQLPARARAVDRPMPARPLHSAWRHLPWPTVELWTGRIDVVHGTNFVVPPTRRAARVVTVHDLTTVRYPELCDRSTLAFPRLVERAIRRGAWVHTPSGHVAGEVIEHFGADPDRVRAVHHGVPAISTCAGPSAGGARTGGSLPPVDSSRYVLALGTVEPRKDLPGLVRAFDLLAGDDPDLRLVVAGPDGWGAEQLSAAIASSPSRDRIVRLGYVEDGERDSLLRNAAVFAYPSVYEGFGLPPLEAMSAGVPVVATAAGALPEVLGSGADLVPVGEVEALAGAIASVLDDDAHRVELVGRGRARAALYRWDRCGEELSALYRDACGSR